MMFNFKLAVLMVVALCAAMCWAQNVCETDLRNAIDELRSRQDRSAADELFSIVVGCCPTEGFSQECDIAAAALEEFNNPAQR